MQRFEGELRRLLEKYPDPRKGWQGLQEFKLKQLAQLCPARLGVVADNKDPECKGRIRVQCDMIGPGAVTPWVQIVHKHKGIWRLPDIGVQTVVGFVGNKIEHPIVLGFIYDEKHRPPLEEGEKADESAVFQTKTHRIDIVYKDGKETFTISSAKGKMRFVMDKDAGMSLINELGDIKIQCRKLSMEAENIAFSAEKEIVVESEDDIEIGASNGIEIENEKEVEVKGAKIDLYGNVQAQDKQMAHENMKVMGFDIHQMEIPAGISTAVVPLPHPFIGKLKDNLSQDVRIGDRNAAYKGSIAKHDSAVHMQLPGTIRFINPPDNKGEVTGATAGKVRINGKEAAVVGSTVTTCNDIGVKDNSRIMAPMTMMVMPKIIHPDNTQAYEREKKEEKKERKFESVRWEKTRVKEGEEVKLKASVKDIEDGNGVTLQVFGEGQEPEDGIAYAKLVLTVEGGAAEGVWSYRRNGNDIPPERNPRFIFSAHSAWCPWKKSENSLEVELRRPKIEKAEWQDADGKTASKGTVGTPVKLYAEVTEFEEGQGVTFTVYNEQTGEDVYEAGSDVQDGKAEALWNPIDTRNPEDTEELKYYIEATSLRCKPVKSGDIQVKNPKVISMEWDKKAIYWGDEIELIIKTIEMEDELPECKVDIWEEEREHPNKLLQSTTVKLDKDEVKVKFTLNFTLKDVSQFDKDDDYRVYAVATIDQLGTYFKQEEEKYLIVSNDF